MPENQSLDDCTYDFVSWLFYNKRGIFIHCIHILLLYNINEHNEVLRIIGSIFYVIKNTILIKYYCGLGQQ